jgi:hypothetical protein
MKKIYTLLLSTLFLSAGFISSVTESLAQSTIIHFWYFDGNIANDTPLTQLDATYSVTAENASLQFQSALSGYPFTKEHPDWRKASMERRNSPTDINYRPLANQGLAYNATNMRGIQVKQPFTGNGGENIMIFDLPTTGFSNPVFNFAARDANAADALIIEYSHTETPVWINTSLQTTVFPLTDAYSLFTVDFSATGNNITVANNNPHFKIRIRFQGQDMTADTGAWVVFNNFGLDATPLSGTNLPPVVANPVLLQQLIANSSSNTLNLNNIFTDPEGVTLTFTANSSNPLIVSTQISGSTITLNPLKPGDSEITLSASDGVNPAVSHVFRTLVYPSAFNLSQGNFIFDTWNNTEPEYSYPANMIFLQANGSDPGLNDDLLFPYYIPHDDYHADDQAKIGFPYSATGRTRITGLGADGVSFINTGRNRDLGGALLAINTMDLSNLMISFKAGTLIKNERTNAWRLQYRIGTTGNFSNLLVNSLPVQYSASTDGDVVNFDNIPLPQVLHGKEYVQLLWRYFLQSGESGPRSLLRLDDIVITKNTSIGLSDQLQYKIFSTNQTIYVENVSDQSATISVFNITGQKIHNQTINGQGLKSIDARFVSGIYIVSIQSDGFNLSRKIIIQ